jgi:hypothetical protein
VKQSADEIKYLLPAKRRNSVSIALQRNKKLDINFYGDVRVVNLLVLLVYDGLNKEYWSNHSM